MAERRRYKKYRKVDPRIWGDARFRSLSDRGKLLFLFVLTHPHLTLLGAMRATPAGLAEELGWTAKDMAPEFEAMLAQGIVQYDADGPILWAPNFLRYNPPTSPNVVTSWRGALELLPECPLLPAVLSVAYSVVEELGDAYLRVLPEEFGGPAPEKEEAPPKPNGKAKAEGPKDGTWKANGKERWSSAAGGWVSAAEYGA